MTCTATQTYMTGSTLDDMMLELRDFQAKNMKLEEDDPGGLVVSKLEEEIPSIRASSNSSEFAERGRHAIESESTSKAVCKEENMPGEIEMDLNIKKEILDKEDCLQSMETFEDVSVKEEFLEDENEVLQKAPQHIEKGKTWSDGEEEEYEESQGKNNRIIDVDNLINFLELFICPQCYSVGGLDFKGERVCPSLHLVSWEFRCRRGHKAVLEDSQCVIVPNLGQSYSKIQLLKASTALTHDEYTEAKEIFKGLDLEYLEKNEELLEDIRFVKCFEKNGVLEFPKDPIPSVIKKKRNPKIHNPSQNDAEETPHISHFISDEFLMKVEKEEENKMISNVLKRLLACKTQPPPPEGPSKRSREELKKIEAIADFMGEEFGVEIQVSESKTCPKRLDSPRKRPLRLRKRVVR